MGVFVIADGKPIRHPRNVLPSLIKNKSENPYAEWRFGYDPLLLRQP